MLQHDVFDQARFGLEFLVAVLAVARRLQRVVVALVTLFLVCRAQLSGTKVARVRLLALRVNHVDVTRVFRHLTSKSRLILPPNSPNPILL